MDEKGFVYLVGAGPGDVKLITVKGLEVLQKAEVIFYDRLVNPLFLQEADANAELIYCGKLPNRHILRQEVINELLVEKAKQGKVVVRLKGGDPGVFGRVGEEASALNQAGVRYEIVPGITSGIAAPMYAGIPVTHREYGTSFTVVTGHDKSVDGKPTINWRALAVGIDTISFYMGIKNLPHICENLINHGRDPSTQVAVIQWGTTSRQRVVEGTLETIADEVANHGISNPAITLVGNIVALRKQIKWFEDKLLLGKKVILADDNAALCSELMNNGAEVLTYPKLSIEPITKEPAYIKKLASLASYDKILFTSKESVQIFFDSLVTNEIDIRSLRANFYSHNQETKQALKKCGFMSEIVIELDTGLIVGAIEAIAELREKGNYLVTHQVKNSYPATVALQRFVEEDSFNTIIFTSARSIKLFYKQTKKDNFNAAEIIENCQVICIGEEAFLTAKKMKLTVNVYTKNLNIENFSYFFSKQKDSEKAFG